MNPIDHILLQAFGLPRTSRASDHKPDVPDRGPMPGDEQTAGAASERAKSGERARELYVAQSTAEPQGSDADKSDGRGDSSGSRTRSDGPAQADAGNRAIVYTQVTSELIPPDVASWAYEETTVASIADLEPLEQRSLQDPSSEPSDGQTHPSDDATPAAVEPDREPVCESTGGPASPAEEPGNSDSVEEMVPGERSDWTAPGASIWRDEPYQTPAWEVDELERNETIDNVVDVLQGDLERLSLRLPAMRRTERPWTGRVVCVRSCKRSEGRTTLAAALALALAKTGKRTALIDADFASPTLATHLGMNQVAGWDTALAAGEPLAEAAIFSVKDQLTLFPLSVETADADSPAPRHLALLLQLVAENHDAVVVDCGPGDEPINHQIQSLPLPQIVVRDTRHQTLKDVEQFCHRMQGRGQRVLGVVENFSIAVEAGLRRSA